MTQRLCCPFCGNPHPRWLLDGMLPESGSVICGATSCGGEMQAASEKQGWSRWNTRTSEPVLREPASLAGARVVVDEVDHEPELCPRCGYPTTRDDGGGTCACNRVPDGARMARCSLCRQEFPDDHLSHGVCATCRTKAAWVHDDEASTHSEP